MPRKSSPFTIEGTVAEPLSPGDAPQIFPELSSDWYMESRTLQVLAHSENAPLYDIGAAQGGINPKRPGWCFVG